MALARKCDRCRKLYEHYPIGNQPGLFNAVRRIRKSSNENIDCTGVTIDLCPECMDILNNFLKGENI